MSVDLGSTELVVERSASHLTMFKNIQCNILKPLGREVGVYLFLTFTGDTAASRALVGKISRQFVKSTQDQLESLWRFRDAKEKKKTVKDTVVPDEPMGAIFISAEGYTHLGLDPEEFDDTDSTFNKGMKNQGSGLIDGLLDRNNKDPKVSTWEGGFQDPIHAMVLLQADSEPTLGPLVGAVKALCAGAANIAHEQDGRVLRENDDSNNEPIEHFGYRDGISQPIFFKEEFAKEGDTTEWNPSANLGLVLTEDPFAGGAEESFGSFFVFRKLKQDVARFNAAVVDLAAALGVSPDYAGAMVVGRFKDGTPLALQDKPGRKTNQNNFEFEDADEDGDKTPRHSHIRKVNPRGTTPFTSLKAEKKRRIARRGMPYTSRDKSDVGLLFMCYQADIAEQFEFIQRTWADNPNFPKNLVFPGTGDDPLIGQDFDPKAHQHWNTEYDKPARKTLSFEGYVTLRGGEYFFAPSMTFLKSL